MSTHNTLGAEWLRFKDEAAAVALAEVHRPVAYFMAGASACYKLLSEGVPPDQIRRELLVFVRELKKAAQ